MLMLISLIEKQATSFPGNKGGKRVCIDVLYSCHKSGKVLLLVQARLCLLLSTHKGLLKTTLDCSLVIILDHLIHKIKWWQYVYTCKSVNPVPIVIKFILIFLISYPLPIINLLSLKWRQFATHDQSTLRSLLQPSHALCSQWHHFAWSQLTYMLSRLFIREFHCRYFLNNLT